ncbi:ABC transporter substrate-binding protein [Noviherbaspirillum galbum]|uniref:ABC transporter substrate-binding protein n=1 Tax=Noviherbaspirillum galbum TaxID=2709383 RepID=A0A6B3SSY6_9BURK|nr:ABC transporter substrate-binding protein [Noviherbaspirillum galbum]NEX61946.1 ABC transporter substrate-binding protein [Noviherbaspirillum galbum]
MIPRLASTLLLACLASLPFLPQQAQGAGNVITIGQAIDLSGPNAALGRDYVAGIKTCFDAVNAAGGINGKRIQYIVQDDHGDAERSAKAVGSLIERDQADFLVGGVGDDTLRAVLESAAFKRSGHMLFAPLAANDYPAGTRALFWRPTFRQELSHVFAHFSRLGASGVGLVMQDTPASADSMRALNGVIAEHKGMIRASVRLAADGSNAAVEARKLAVAKPDFIVVVADTIGTALFLKEFRKVDAQTFVAGTSLINLETLRELAGAKAVEWTVFSQVVPNPAAGNSMIQMEHLKMMRKYRDEAVSSLTLEGYAAAKVLVRIIQQARGGRQALHETLAQPTEIELGGLAAATGTNRTRLSSYLDIALFKKGVLMF